FCVSGKRGSSSCEEPDHADGFRAPDDRMSLFRFWKNFVGDIVTKLTVACVSPLLRPDFDRRITAAAVLFSAGCIPSVAVAAAAESQVFNLPADVASKALQQFAEQAGTEVVFATEATGRVRTNAVQGRFTTQQAIERLLQG